MKKMKEHDPYGKVTHARTTGDRPSPPTGVGNESKPDMKGTQEGGSRAEGARGHVGHTHLSHAAAELHRQHPHHHSEGGIHHTSDHLRHEPHGRHHRG